MKKASVLVVEDDEALGDAICETLTNYGHENYLVTNILDALKALKTRSINVILTDMNLKNGTEGLDLIHEVRAKASYVPIIVMTAFGSIENAVAAMQAGAVDYLIKPFVPDRLLNIIQKYAINDDINVDEPLVFNKAMKDLYMVAKKAAQNNVTILVYGETGTGKEVLAKYIHSNSHSNNGPFVAVNCAAIPENMLEALLFGYEKGAFTGAYQACPGKFEQAQDGTILLDEISEMPLTLQAKLLRVLQEKEIERLGGKKTIKLNIRVIAATNKHLRSLVAKKQFRSDLYFRLSVFPLTIPSLRERTDEIIPFAELILEKFSRELKKSASTLTHEAKEYLMQKKWKGNIRELENVIQRALILSSDSEITVDDLMLGDFEELVTTNKEAMKEEYNNIIAAMESNNGSKHGAAKMLGISKKQLTHKITKLKSRGYTVPEYEQDSLQDSFQDNREEQEL